MNDKNNGKHNLKQEYYRNKIRITIKILLRSEKR